MAIALRNLDFVRVKLLSANDRSRHLGKRVSFNAGMGIRKAVSSRQSTKIQGPDSTSAVKFSPRLSFIRISSRSRPHARTMFADLGKPVRTVASHDRYIYVVNAEPHSFW